jgi:hypothetical protein
MVALTSNTTKVCDVSKTTIYRANSPIIYACVNDLDFIAYIANQGCWWSFRYILNHAKQHTMMQSMQGKCLRTKPNHKTQFPINPQNFSPIGIHCQNGQKKL